MSTVLVRRDAATLVPVAFKSDDEAMAFAAGRLDVEQVQDAAGVVLWPVDDAVPDAVAAPVEAPAKRKKK
jgi:hypothetical protein